MDILYINNDNIGSNSVTAFEVDSSDALVPLPSGQATFSTGGMSSGGSTTFTSSIVQSHGFLFVTNEGDFSVTTFSIKPKGDLIFVDAVPAGVDFSGSLAVTRDGKHLIVAGFGISLFEIGQNGALTHVATTPFGNTVTVLETGLLLSPNGAFLVRCQTQARQLAITSFLVPPLQLGLLLGTSSFATGSVMPGGMDVKPTGVPGFPALLFVGSCAAMTTQVSVFLMRFTGQLDPVPGSPFTFASGNGSTYVRLSHDGALLFVADFIGSTVTVLRVGLTVTPAGQVSGQLALAPGSPVSLPSTTTRRHPAVAFLERADNRNLLFVATEGNAVTIFRFRRDGTLRQVPGSPFPAGDPQALSLQSGMVYVQI